MNTAHEEQVAYVRRALLESTTALDRGFQPDQNFDLYGLFLDHVEFDDRSALEEDPSRKQLIPYVVVSDGEDLFTLRRKSAQTEERLHDKISFGVGGHVNPDGVRADGAEDVLEGGMLRELHEELHVDAEPEINYRGTLNDDSNPVGEVHLGVVYSCTVPRGAVSVRETEKMEGEWLAVEEIHELSDQLESWSYLLLDAVSDWLEHQSTNE